MPSPWIENVDESNFEEKVIAVSKQTPVVVDFWAPWCGPCQSLGPTLERVVDSYPGKVRLAKLNTDENPNLAYRYGIQGIPAVKAFIDGQVVDEFVGLLSERQVREFVQALIPSEADRISQEAQSLEAADPDGAIRRYEEALKQSANHADSLIGKLRILIALNRTQEARTFFNRLPATLQYHKEFPRLRALLDLAAARRSGPSLPELKARVEKEPDDPQALWDLAVRLAADGIYREAMETYLTLLKKDRKFKNEGARKAILQIFDIVGPRSPLAEEYREKMARILY